MTTIVLVLAWIATAMIVVALPGFGAALDPDKFGQKRWYRLPESIAAPLLAGSVLASSQLWGLYLLLDFLNN